MAQTSTVLGMVIASTPVGEFDRRVVLLTRERGKISGFAKGARRVNSPLLASTDPFAFGRFELFEGRNSYTIRQADIQNFFGEFRTDLEGAWYGMYFLELADYFTRENNDEVEMLKLLYQTLRALSCDSIKNELIRYIYEWKTIVINGEYPDIFTCKNCGESLTTAYFHGESYQLFCPKCVTGKRAYIPLNQSTLYALQFIASSPVEKLYTFSVTQEVFTQLRTFITFCKKRVVDRELKSEQFLRCL